MNETNPICIAQTKSGGRCRNKAMDNSELCYIHRHYKLEQAAEAVALFVNGNGATVHPAEALAAVEPPAAVQPMEEAAAPQTTAPQTTAPQAAIPIVEEAVEAAPDLFQRLMRELDHIVEEIRGRAPGVVPADFSAERLIELLKTNLEKAPILQRALDSQLAADLQAELADKAPQELLTLETWQRILCIVNDALQAQTEQVRAQTRDHLTERLQQLPTQPLLDELRAEVKLESPQDLLALRTWQQILVFASDRLEHQARALRERVRKS